MAKHAKIIDEYAGIPVTATDLQHFTTVEERRGYRVVAAAGALLFVASLVPALAGVTTDLSVNLWWALALLGASLVLAYGALGWGPTARRARRERDVVATLDQQRLESFWYERGVANGTPEATFRGPEERP